MNRGELRSLSLEWLDDPDGGYFQESFMNRCLNQAQREVQKLLLQAGESYYTECVETSTVASQRDYALPSDFLDLELLERVVSGSGDTADTIRIHPMRRSEIHAVYYNFSNTGKPYNYVINKNTFSLFPVPDSVETLRLWYAPRVADMANDAAEPDCPEDYHEFIAILAARDGFLKDGRSLGPIESKLAYFEKLLKETAESRNVDSPRMVTVTEGGFGAF